MRAVDAFLLQLDHAWDHAWESLRPVLESVGEEEAAWQPPGYRGLEGAPPPGSVRRHVAHLAHCKREYAARLEGDREAPAPSLPPEVTNSLAEDLEALHRAHHAQRAALAALADGDLTPNVAEFVAAFLRHDAWHGGRIALARRLYRNRP